MAPPPDVAGAGTTAGPPAGRPAEAAGAGAPPVGVLPRVVAAGGAGFLGVLVCQTEGVGMGALPTGTLLVEAGAAPVAAAGLAEPAGGTAAVPAGAPAPGPAPAAGVGAPPPAGILPTVAGAGGPAGLGSPAGAGGAAPADLAPAGSVGMLGGAAGPAAGLSAGAVGMLPSAVGGGGPALYVSNMTGWKRMGKSSLLEHIHVRTLGILIVQVLVPVHTELGLITRWCRRRSRRNGGRSRCPSS